MTALSINRNTYTSFSSLTKIKVWRCAMAFMKAVELNIKILQGSAAIDLRRWKAELF